MKTWILAAGVLWAASGQAQPQAPVAQTYEQARAVAKAKHEAKDVAGALEVVHLAAKLAKTPDEKSEALLLVGQSYKEQNELEAAIAAWRQVLEVPGAPWPAVVAARMGIGGALLDQGKGSEARSEFKVVLASPQAENNTKASVQMGIAFSYDQEKDFEHAREAFAVLADNAKAEPFLRFMAQQSIGETYFKERNFAGARAAWEKLLAMPLAVPQLPFALAGGAEARIIDSYVEEKNLEQAARSRQQFHLAHARRLQPLIKVRQWAAAREELAAMIVLSPPGSVLLGLQTMVGNSYANEGNYAQSRAEFEKVVASTPAPDATQAERDAIRMVQQSAQMSIGEVYARENRVAQARAQFEKVLALPGLNANIKAATERNLAKLPTP